MNNLIVIILCASFGVLMANLGYGVLARPDIFWPSCIIFSLFCALMVNK